MYFIIFDLEATCWMGAPPGGQNEIIEIGAVKLDRFGHEISKFNKFVKPLINPTLSVFCKNLTSIDQSSINIANTFDVVIEEFKEWIGVYESEYLLCSWGIVDHRYLIQDSKLHKLEIEWLEKYIDIKGQYFDLNKQAKKTGLKNTIKREGFEFTGVPHRAISDAENTAKIFSKYIDMWYF